MTQRYVGRLLKFNVSIPLWLIILASTATIAASYMFAKNHREDIKFITAVIGSAAAIYSAYYIGASLKVGLEDKKKEHSFELLSMLNKPEFVAVRRFIEKEIQGHESLSRSELYDKITKNEQLLQAVTTVLGIFEDISLAIQQDYVDENIIFLSLSGMMPWNYLCLRGYIEQEREHMKDNKYYMELEKLVTSWKSGRRLSDGCAVPPPY